MTKCQSFGAGILFVHMLPGIAEAIGYWTRNPEQDNN